MVLIGQEVGVGPTISLDAVETNLAPAENRTPTGTSRYTDSAIPEGR